MTQTISQTWQPYAQVHPHNTVTGQVLVATAVYSPQLDNKRDILIYLPPSYAKSDKRYPVLYMHDGQNLFDAHTSYVGEWRVDESMEKLSREEGLEAIIVGLPHPGEARQDEYSPFPDETHGGGQGNVYLDFLGETIKPMIDSAFRTLPERSHTGIAGSSMGGLISLYAYFRHPDLFGFAGALSPALWFGDYAIFDYVETAPFVPGKIYLDVGTREHGNSLPEILTLRARSRRYYGKVRRMKRLLVRKGFRPVRDLLHVEAPRAVHNEAEWAKRFPTAVRFFLQNLP